MTEGTPMRSNIATAINAGVEAAKSEVVRCAAECAKLLAELTIAMGDLLWQRAKVAHSA